MQFLQETAPTLYFSSQHKAAIEAAAQGSYASETCGLLVGGSTATAIWLCRIEIAENRAQAESCQHFVLDPLTLLRVENEARAQNLAIVGVWHSHLSGPPTPSLEDQRTANPGWCYWIVGLERHVRLHHTSHVWTGSVWIPQTLHECKDPRRAAYAGACRLRTGKTNDPDCPPNNSHWGGPLQIL